MENIQKNNSELCQDIKQNLEKFSRYNNIYRALLYDYNLFCKKDNDYKNTNIKFLKPF
jgi:hypothetical protein